MLENEVYSKIIACLLGIVGSLLLFGGSLITYIFKRHVQDNDYKFENNDKIHIRIFDQINGKVDKK